MNDGPLGEHAFLVMTVLAAGAQHGYAIMEDLRGRDVRLHAGTTQAELRATVELTSAKKDLVLVEWENQSAPLTAL